MSPPSCGSIGHSEKGQRKPNNSNLKQRYERNVVCSLKEHNLSYSDAVLCSGGVEENS
jgi:hypothetical protein